MRLGWWKLSHSAAISVNLCSYDETHFGNIRLKSTTCITPQKPTCRHPSPPERLTGGAGAALWTRAVPQDSVPRRALCLVLCFHHLEIVNCFIFEIVLLSKFSGTMEHVMSRGNRCNVHNPIFLLLDSHITFKMPHEHRIPGDPGWMGVQQDTARTRKACDI